MRRFFRLGTVGVFCAGILGVLQGCSSKEFIVLLAVLLGIQTCNGPGGYSTSAVVEPTGSSISLPQGITVVFQDGFFTSPTEVTIKVSAPNNLPNGITPVSDSVSINFDGGFSATGNQNSMIIVTFGNHEGAVDFSRESVASPAGLPAPVSHAYETIYTGIVTLNETLSFWGNKVVEGGETVVRYTKQGLQWTGQKISQITTTVVDVATCFDMGYHFYKVQSATDFKEIDTENLGQLGSKVPVILVHGWQPGTDWCVGGSPQKLVKNGWGNLISHLADMTDIQLYAFRYDTDHYAYEAAAVLDRYVTEIFGFDREIIIIGHSFGGLVARSLVYDTSGYLRDNTNHILGIITLGTPHLGSPLANDEFQKTISWDCTYFMPLVELGTITNSADNLDNDLGKNTWLANLNRQLYRYDEKMALYAGAITDATAHGVYNAPYSCLTNHGYQNNDGVVPFRSGQIISSETPATDSDSTALINYDHSQVQIGGSSANTVLFDEVREDILGFLSPTPPPQPVNRNSVLIYTGNGGGVTFNQLSQYYSSQGHPTITSKIFPEDLSPYKLIILPLPAANFTTDQISSFQAYLQTRGRLLVLGDHSGYFGYQTVNDLLDKLDIDITQNADAAITDADSCDPINEITYDQYLTIGVGSIDFSASSSLDVYGRAVSLVRVPAGLNCGGDAGATLIAFQKTSSRPGGEVIVSGDSNWLDDYAFSDPRRDGMGDTLRFLDNLINY